MREETLQNMNKDQCNWHLSYMPTVHDCWSVIIITNITYKGLN